MYCVNVGDMYGVTVFRIQQRERAEYRQRQGEGVWHLAAFNITMNLLASVNFLKENPL